MTLISNVIFYVLSFLTVYAQVFFLITFLENRKKIIIRNGTTKLAKYPKVTIIVPCWNEEKTVYKTIRSLLNLNYPKDKVKIFLIDDGSTDNTWDVISRFSKYPNIKVFKKENGGKYTALNLGLKHIQTDFLGCLDADSVADPESLVRIMSYFEKDPSIMAVSPSIIANKSKNIIQEAQKVEYWFTVFVKKMLGIIGGIFVTPGPLTIFRKKVFDDLGPYRHAHNTEDMEIAYRMQKNHYKIEQCNDAYIYTNTPSSITKLYKQRLRWIYGSINNAIDYRKLFFKKKYGNFSIFTLPSIIFSIITTGYLTIKMLYSFIDSILLKISEFNVVGLDFTKKTFVIDPYFINTKTLFFISMSFFIFMLFFTIYGKKMVDGKWTFPLNIFFYFIIFSIIGPFWFLKAVYNTILSRKPAWR